MSHPNTLQLMLERTRKTHETLHLDLWSVDKRAQPGRVKHLEFLEARRHARNLLNSLTKIMGNPLEIPVLETEVKVSRRRKQDWNLVLVTGKGKILKTLPVGKIYHAPNFGSWHILLEIPAGEYRKIRSRTSGDGAIWSLPARTMATPEAKSLVFGPKKGTEGFPTADLAAEYADLHLEEILTEIRILDSTGESS